MHAVKMTALGLCGILLFSGCAATPLAVENRSVGQCWQSDETSQSGQMNVPAGNPMDCSSASSTAYTFFVGGIAGAPANGYLSDGFLVATTISALPERLQRQTSDECGANLQKLFSGQSVLSLGQLRVVSAVTFPSVAQWNNGERWFSCELSLRELGSSLTKPTWQTLPSPISLLISAVAATPENYRLCVETSRNSVDPESSAGVLSSCNGARWAVRPLSLGVTYGQIYPGAAKASSLAAMKCEAANRGALKVIASTVSNFDWQAPEPWVACWVSSKADTVATPTPEPATPSPSPSSRRVIPVVPTPVESDPVVVPEFSPPPTNSPVPTAPLSSPTP